MESASADMFNLGLPFRSKEGSRARASAEASLPENGGVAFCRSASCPSNGAIVRKLAEAMGVEAKGRGGLVPSATMYFRQNCKILTDQQSSVARPCL